jgi:hypothetical protein
MPYSSQKYPFSIAGFREGQEVEAAPQLRVPHHANVRRAAESGYDVERRAEEMAPRDRQAKRAQIGPRLRARPVEREVDDPGRGNTVDPEKNAVIVDLGNKQNVAQAVGLQKTEQERSDTLISESLRVTNGTVLPSKS